jgi:hypothetical protein
MTTHDTTTRHQNNVILLTGITHSTKYTEVIVKAYIGFTNAKANGLLVNI